MRTHEFRKSGDDVKIHCPDCGGQYKLYVNFKKGIYHCFKCGAKGRTKGHRFGNLDTYDEKPKDPEELPGGLVSIAANLSARMYFENRGIIPQEDWKYCTWGKYQDRIILPIRCFGKYWGFQARALESYESRRYLSSVGLPISKVFWGWDNLRKDTEAVFITEGIFAARWINQNSFALPAIACFTKRLSAVQAAALATRFRTCIIAFDKDASSESLEAGWTLYGLGVRVFIVNMKQKGPDDHTVEEFKTLDILPLSQAVKHFAKETMR